MTVLLSQYYYEMANNYTNNYKQFTGFLGTDTFGPCGQLMTELIKLGTGWANTRMSKAETKQTTKKGYK